jgi:hypothetical protein
VRNPALDEKTREFWLAYDRRTYYQASFGPAVDRLAPLFRRPLSARSVHIFIDTSEYYSINDDKYSPSAPSKVYSCTLHGMKMIAREIMTKA